jgi:hypothetical protein
VVFCANLFRAGRKEMTDKKEEKIKLTAYAKAAG